MPSLPVGVLPRPRQLAFSQFKKSQVCIPRQQHSISTLNLARRQFTATITSASCDAVARFSLNPVAGVTLAPEKCHRFETMRRWPLKYWCFSSKSCDFDETRPEIKLVLRLTVSIHLVPDPLLLQISCPVVPARVRVLARCQLAMAGALTGSRMEKM